MAQRPKSGFPGAVTAHSLDCAVGELQLQLQEKSGAAAVHRTLVVMSQGAGVPAIAQDRAKRIVARGNEAGDVIGLIMHALAEIRPAGGEDVLAHRLAVEPQFIDAESGDVGGGTFDRAGHREFFAQVRGWHPGQVRFGVRMAPWPSGEQLGR